jgi:hypothetical protein
MKVIGKGERGVVYGLAGLVDLVQLILDILVVTEIANHIIDIVFGILLAIYAVLRKILTVKKSLVLIAYFCAEQIPFVNAVPFWTLDVRNLYSGVPKTKEELNAQKEIEPEWVTLPRNQKTPLNEGGSRQPRVKTEEIS